MELGDVLHDGQVEVACLLERMTFFGGGVLGILEEGVEP
jgi:hypothetical protein